MNAFRRARKNASLSNLFKDYHVSEVRLNSPSGAIIDSEDLIGDVISEGETVVMLWKFRFGYEFVGYPFGKSYCYFEGVFVLESLLDS